ncbi:alcohol dehydrogenase [Xylogone sp. PMI_703]|nr:alcohol dehydrogenase [Xylogone sp. PMI_703]
MATATTTTTAVGGAKLIPAIRYHGPKQLQLDWVNSMPCGPNEVRVKVAYCGICGSDIHEYEAGPIFSPPVGTRNPYSGLELPMTMGHEYSGTVLEIGSDVTNVAVGQNVVVDPVLHDRHYGLPPCDACLSGTYNTCQRSSVCGLAASGGGLSSETLVRASLCIPLPSSISLKVGALAQPLTIAWHAIRMSGFKKGDKALVCGAGPIGLAILVLLRVWGASIVAITEVTESRVRKAKHFGADVVINPNEKIRNADGTERENSVKAVVDEITTGKMVDVAFVAASHQSALDAAIAATRIGGTILNAAIHSKPVQVNLNDLTIPEKRLLTSMRCTDEDWIGVLDVLEHGRIPAIEDMITSIVPLSNAVNGAFLELINNTANHVKILIQPDV